jgi:hypothetical protein
VLPDDALEQLSVLANLHDEGNLTADEYAAAKRVVLSEVVARAEPTGLALATPPPSPVAEPRSVPLSRHMPGSSVDGTPTPAWRPDRRRIVVVIAGAAVVLIVLVGLLTGAVTGPGVEAEQKSPPITTVPVQTISPPSQGETLQMIAAEDRAQVALLADQWVPQIASRREYEYSPRGLDVRTEHAQLVDQFPQALLLLSGDYTSYRVPDYWVTIVGTPFDTAEGANSWCDRAGLPPDDCYAKYISSRVGSSGTSVFRH